MPASAPATARSTASARSGRLAAVLLAESLRRHAETAADATAGLDDPARLRVAAAAAIEPEARLLAWAETDPQAAAIRREQARALRALPALAATALLLIALLSGSGLGLLLGAGGTINASAVLGGLLGWPLAMLLLWLLLTLLGQRRQRQRPPGPAHRLFARALRRVEPALSAALVLLGRGAFGHWSRATALHLGWAAAFAGTLFALLAQLLFRRYDFVWETTLLSPAALAAVLDALAAGPARLGLATPSAEGGDRRVWAQFVIACVLLYGLLPRLLAAAIGFMLARRAFQRPLLDLADPFWVRRLLAIQRAVQTVAPIGAVAPARLDRPAPAATPDRRPQGPLTVLLGYETEPAAPGRETDAAADGPDMLDLGMLDLGTIDDRATLHQVCADLAALPSRPAALLIAVSLLRTPDRGAEAAFAALRAAAGCALVIALEDRDAAVERGLDVDARIAAWRRSAETAGMARVVTGSRAATLAALRTEGDAA